jgi:uncharacterized protein YgbK (DUF1537 family)
MIEELDDLTLVYMYGAKNGRDSMKDEIERLRAALRRVVHADGVTDEIVEIARAALEGEKTDV